MARLTDFHRQHRGSAGSGPEPPDDRWQLLKPFPATLVQPVEDLGLEALYNHAIGTFHFAIGLWMCNGRPVHVDVVVVAKLQEFSADKLEVIVSDGGVWHPKPMDDVREE
jgi:hypothetical protein